MDMATEPLAELTTLLKLSSTETATLGMALPAVPGPGVAGVKASLEGVAAAITVATVEVAVVIERELSVAVKV
jgi:hypothetical protein